MSKRKKCNCLRIGRRFNARCSRLLIGCETVPCNNEVRYLGISIKSARTFKCIMSMNKQKFYRAANCVISKSRMQECQRINCIAIE